MFLFTWIIIQLCMGKRYVYFNTKNILVYNYFVIKKLNKKLIWGFSYIYNFFAWLIKTRFFSTESSFADTIQPLSSEKYVVEGKNVTLSCNYSTSSGNVNSLQWYRQYIGAKLEFLLLVNEYSSKSEPDLRLYSKATKEIKRVDLVISSAAVSDSALYYCALEPTVTGNTRTLYKNLSSFNPMRTIIDTESKTKTESVNCSS